MTNTRGFYIRNVWPPCLWVFPFGLQTVVICTAQSPFPFIAISQLPHGLLFCSQSDQWLLPGSNPVGLVEAIVEFLHRLNMEALRIGACSRQVVATGVKQQAIPISREVNREVGSLSLIGCSPFHQTR
ncbi:MAG: hypothetical protein EDM05_64740 [Leptolyngbya sp. IPPAS B-1204]|nr:hypothetical protein [Elainella sp. C42_A2020_010]